MEWHYYVSLGISIVSVLSGFFVYIISLRIQHDILKNNVSIEKEITDEKEKRLVGLNALRDEVVREIGSHLSLLQDKVDRAEKLASEVSIGMPDRILTVVNAKYVRTDIYLLAMNNIQERFVALKDLMEITIEKMERSLDQQILDLKDRVRQPTN